jgi:hypothetical protein
MNLDFQSPAARGLRRYVRLVAATLNPAADCSAVHWDHPLNAYLALSGRLHWFPDRTVALTWDGRDGWAMVLTKHSGGSLLVLRYLGHDVLPAPRAVATFSARLFRDEFAGQADPPTRPAREDPDLVTRLACYATSSPGRHRRHGHPVHLHGVITSRPAGA